jgi:hypothetical protein
MLKKFVLALAVVALVEIKAEAAESELQRIADALDVSSIKTFQLFESTEKWRAKLC